MALIVSVVSWRNRVASANLPGSLLRRVVNGSAPLIDSLAFPRMPLAHTPFRKQNATMLAVTICKRPAIHTRAMVVSRRSWWANGTLRASPLRWRVKVWFRLSTRRSPAGIKVKPEVMIPLVGFKKELDLQVAVVHAAAKAVMAVQKVKLSYRGGTMIEVPRGALTADEIAQTAEFFSFGTNDLTRRFNQPPPHVVGYSRDDSGSLLPPYAELEICKTNPFALIDQAGIGQLMKIACEKGNQTRPGIKLGICGEPGGDPNSVKFCHKISLTYVSCSPFRVPVARLAAAQAALEEEATQAAKPAKKK